jgi:UV DNA damage repair endonuclease
MSWGIDASLELANHVALVLDIHHHWVASGEYILPTDDRFSRIIDSWRGVRPVIHYSVSREDLLDRQAKGKKPNMQALLEQGYKKQKLRAHSDYMWNRAVNDWALTFLPYADIMVESKCKNLSSIELYNYANTGKNHFQRGSNEVLRFQQSQSQSNGEAFTATEEMLPVS